MNLPPLYDTGLYPRLDNDSNIGSAAKSPQSSASSVLTTLAPVAAYAAGFFTLFLIVRRWYPGSYSPRSLATGLRPQERTKSLPNGLFDWFQAYWRIPDIHVLNTQSLDGYLFLRLLRISVISCTVGCIITWPILFPINATGYGEQRQLNILTFSNVAGKSHPASYYRFYAHVFCAWIYFGFVIAMITRESLFFVNLRQAYLVSPLYANRISSRTVLYSSVPKPYQDDERLRELLGKDIVRNIWIPRDTKELEDKVSERDSIALKLEKAEINLIKMANEARRKALTKGVAYEDDEEKANVSTEPGSVAARWIKDKDRPTHRLKFLIGKKVDTINWCRERLAELIPEVKEMQQAYKDGQKGKLLSSALVEFETLQAAQNAFQDLTHHQALHMSPRYTGIISGEIIWFNMRMLWYERVMRNVGSTAAIVALIIFWSLPVALVGTISQITFLTRLPGLQWLKFLLSLPLWLRGVVTGLLPSVLLAVLMSLLPIFLRFMAVVSGVQSQSQVEYHVQNSYFGFQVVQVFLVATLSSGAAQAAAKIVQSPFSAVSLLADSLPQASNFYLSYFILQGLAVVSQTVLQLTGLLVAILLSRFLDKTPRKKYNRWINFLTNPRLGTLYPIYTNLWVIALAYSCIAPLVLAFGAIGLGLFYLAYRYEFFFVYNVPYDTKGLMYPRALQQLFVGLYLAQLCMIGLLAVNVGNQTAVLGPLVLMIIFLVFTALWHVSLNAALRPLLSYLPKTVETEERRLLAEEEALIADVEDKEVFVDASEMAPGTNGKAGTGILRSESALMGYASDKPLPPPSRKKVNFLKKWLRPDIYTDYRTLRTLVPRGFADITYDEETERNAYQHPSITAEPPMLWIPRDEAGVSKQELRDTSKVIKITDEDARLDEKGNVVWDRSSDGEVIAPIQEVKVYY